MRHGKRAIIIMLLVGIAAAGFASGKDEGSAVASPSGAPVLLKWWGGVPAEYGPEIVVKMFNEAYKDKGIQAEYVRYVNDDTGNVKLETTLLSGGDIDVFMTYNASNLYKRGTGGMTLELGALLKKAKFDVLKELGEGAAPYIYDGKYYGLPTKMENYFLLANKNMFDAAGIPLPESWTYDDFRKVAKQLTKGEGQSKIYGMYWNSAQEIFRPSYICQRVLGPNFLYKEGGKETNLDNPEFVQFNQMVQDMMWIDKSTITHTDHVTQKLSVESTFLAGKAAMSVGVWTIRSIKDLEKYPHDFVTAYLPVPVSSTSKAKYGIGEGVIGDYICINPQTKNPDQAFEFLLWYIKGGMLGGTPYGRVPIYKGISPEKIADEYMKNGDKILDRATVIKFLTPAKNMAVSVETNKLPEIWKTWCDALELVYTNQKSAAAALGEAKIKADAFLK